MAADRSQVQKLFGYWLESAHKLYWVAHKNK